MVKLSMRGVDARRFVVVSDDGTSFFPDAESLCRPSIPSKWFFFSVAGVNQIP